jgi:hypothetical protein
VDSNWGGSGNTGDIIFREASSEKMRITGSGNVGVGTSSPGQKLHVNGNLRLGSSLDDTVDDDANRSISTAGQLTIKSNDSGANNSYVNLMLQAGKTNPGKIVIGGGDASATSNPDIWRDIEFYTSGSSTERMRIHHDGNVGINTSSPGRKLEVFTGNGAIPGLRLRRYATGATYTDFQHADSTSPASSKEGLAIITSDGNATTQEVMRICGDGSVGINTTNPQAPFHNNNNKAIINSLTSYETIKCNKTGGGNSGGQTRRYYRVYVGNGYQNFGVIFRGIARNNAGWGDMQDWRRQYTVQRNVNASVGVTHDSSEDINASGFGFAVTTSGSSTSTQEVHFDVTFPPKPQGATYIVFIAEVFGDTASFANGSGP